jgi:uncharacterized sulfatase
VRYWAAVGYVVRGAGAVGADEAALVSLLDDQEPGPRCAAGEALARWGRAPNRTRAVDVLLSLSDATTHPEYVAALALNALVQVPDLSDDVRQRAAALPRAAVPSDQRANNLTYLVDQVSKGIR